jgi:hypothetical protein
MIVWLAAWPHRQRGDDGCELYKIAKRQSRFSMILCARLVSTALTFIIVVATAASALCTVAHADKIKTPPPKDASQKGQDCGANSKLKSSEKIFCGTRDLVRGRVVDPKTENADKTQPAARKLGQ